jgi:hypothetical protein
VGNPAAGSKLYPSLRKCSSSKNACDYAPQIVIGMAVTREALPVRYWVFPGNTADVATVQRGRADLWGWQLDHCRFMVDGGMVSRAKFNMLSRGGGLCILCMPVHPRGKPPPR